MTKINDIIVLMTEARSERTSMAAVRRCVKAAKRLSFTNEEIIELMYWLDYCDAEGVPFKRKNANIVRVWP